MFEPTREIGGGLGVGLPGASMDFGLAENTEEPVRLETGVSPRRLLDGDLE